MKALTHSDILAWGGVENRLLSTPVLIALAILSTLGLAFFFPLFDLDEGAFSEATRELLQSGNWISTYLNGEPRYDKPILIYWLQALSVKGFGLHTISFRLPSIIAALLWLYFSFRFVREMVNDRSARIFVWMLCCCPVATVIFKSATADALLNLLINLTFFEIYRLNHKASVKRLCGIALLTGLGFLTKGPVAAVLPVAASLIAFALGGRFRLWLWAVGHPLSWFTFLLVVVPWHVAIYLDQGSDFFRSFYLGHNLGRFSNTMESHGGSVFYYVLLLPVILLPFSGLLFRLAKELPRARGNLLPTFLWSWFLLVLAIFSFSGTQLPHYILYGMSPLFILLATHLDAHYDSLQSNGSGRGMLSIALAGSAIFTLLPFALLLPAMAKLPPYEHEVARAAKEIFLQVFALPAVSLFVCTAAMTLSSGLTRLHKLLLNALAILLGINFILLPLVAESRQKPVYQAALIARELDGDFVSWRINMPSFSVYSRHITQRREPHAGDYVFTSSVNLADLRQQFSAENIQVFHNADGILLCHIRGPYGPATFIENQRSSPGRKPFSQRPGKQAG